MNADNLLLAVESWWKYNGVKASPWSGPTRLHHPAMTCPDCAKHDVSGKYYSGRWKMSKQAGDNVRMWRHCGTLAHIIHVYGLTVPQIEELITIVRAQARMRGVRIPIRKG